MLMKPSRNIDELEQIAARVRCSAGLESVGTFDVIEVVEQRLLKIFPGLKLIRVSDEQLPHAEAEANSSTNTILIRENTYQQAKDWQPRARLIVMEEVCHIALGHTGRATDGTLRKAQSTVEQKSETNMKRASLPPS